VTTRLIIDTDPGIDDAVAILLAAASPEVSLQALITVAGNVPVTQTTANAAALADLIDSDVPVARGAAGPLCGRPGPHATAVHGQNGLAGYTLPASHRNILEANDLYRQILHSAPATVAAIGPLTNIANLVTHAPSTANRIEHLVIMGGSTTHGNVTADAEFNIYADPEAAACVLNSQLYPTLIGLNITERALVGPSHVPARGTATELANHLFQGRNTQQHDSLALAYTIDPSLVKTLPARVRVECDDERSRGKTHVDFHSPSPNCLVGVEVDVVRFRELLLSRLAALDAQLDRT
jgi:inosine-uridine nucleoside N-ribohydrolase